MLTLIKSQPDWEKYDWEFTTVNPNTIKDSALFDIKYELSDTNKPKNRKIVVLMELLEEGVKFPPIVIYDNKVLDGTHRLAIYKYLGKKRIKILRRTEGKGKVKGKYNCKCKFPYKNAVNPRCLVCNELLKFKNAGNYTGPMATFPHGLPQGPLWYCIPCGMYYKKDFIICE